MNSDMCPNGFTIINRLAGRKPIGKVWTDNHQRVLQRKCCEVCDKFVVVQHRAMDVRHNGGNIRCYDHLELLTNEA